ncbi:ATP-binding protein [Rhodoferax sp. WC2427]|uniref:ATP-binding protein n=1 Tax=Rhodoferax sp. WC2427 TaxID=3234144 RepID=UPI0034660FA8
MSETSLAFAHAASVLFVDDEPLSCKWFARSFADEFTILTATSVDAALALLQDHSAEIAVLVTDYRMPQRDGMDLLRTVLREYRPMVRMLATGHADKALAIAAVNEGQVFRILEKPLAFEPTRQALRDALALHHQQALQHMVHAHRVTALRDTVGFLAHELMAPLGAVRGYLTAVKERHLAPGFAPADIAGMALFAEAAPGEILQALVSAERQTLFCQSLVSSFVQSARDAYPGAPDAPQPVMASSLLQYLLDEYPFVGDERAWVSTQIEADFVLPGRRDLLYLVLCTLTKNALLALRDRPQPGLHIWLGFDADTHSTCIRIADNGPGIAPVLLERLTLRPIAVHADTGRHGMGLLLCRRVLESMGGSIAITSVAGQGACVALYFQSFSVDKPGKAPYETRQDPVR